MISSFGPLARPSDSGLFSLRSREPSRQYKFGDIAVPLSRIVRAEAGGTCASRSSWGKGGRKLLRRFRIGMAENGWLSLWPLCYNSPAEGEPFRFILLPGR